MSVLSAGVRRRRGQGHLWRRAAPVAPPEAAPEVPTCHAFAEEWWTLYVDQWDDGTERDYRVRLEVHLNPWFGETRLNDITYDTVERFIAAELVGGWKPGGGPVAPSTLNKLLGTLCRILDRAVKRGLIDQNPAADKDLRVRDAKPATSYLGLGGADRSATRRRA